MQTTQHSHTVELAAHLTERLPRHIAPHTELVLENDLAGRAVLAMLWPQREHLTIHLVSAEPVPNHVKALQSGIATVRKAPTIQRVSHDQLVDIAARAPHLIWALTADRTSSADRRTLQERDHSVTYTPLFDGFADLDGKLPDQQDPVHELYFRDLIHDHAKFLNFFGDRFNPLDLYQRSKHPVWIQPPSDFEAALPALRCVIETLDGKPLQRQAFSGTLQLPARQLVTGNRAVVDFQPVFDVLARTVDLTLELENTYQNPAGQGVLEVVVEYDHRILLRQDIALSEPITRLSLAAVHPESQITVAVQALADQQKASWAEASTTEIRLTVHPLGTHPTPGLLERLATWFNRLRYRRSQGGSSHHV